MPMSLLCLRKKCDMLTVMHLAWQNGVCHGRADFDFTFKNKTRFLTGVPRPSQTWLVA